VSIAQVTRRNAAEHDPAAAPRSGSRSARPAPVVRLGGFVATPPRYQIAQDRSLAWLADAHAAAETVIGELDAAASEGFATRIGRVLARCGCPPDQIATRGHSVADVDAGRGGFADGILYDVARHPHGRSTGYRMRLYAELIDAYFTAAYAGDGEPPDDLVHVTCTGYVSPSGAQKLVAARGWGARTRVTHAYHMGCYAAVPAIRIAAGFTAVGSRRVDIVHTELCSLHLDPADHSVEQLVVQSLFADGLIRYGMTADDRGPGLELIGAYEQVVPDTADAMTWIVADRGMEMTLARSVPDRVAGAVRGFVLELYRRAGKDLAALPRCVFAVHPGGPKILDGVQCALELEPAQLATSRAVLRDHGNMSSATLPHIWMRLLADPAVAPGTLIPSLAFGPGLTLCGALFEKRA
jgi:predicted naringenin-chalcone synthase